ncbi:UNVERIFIED_CONTAM: hypothetical protein K2H54_031127 [Gekko kuhli]
MSQQSQPLQKSMRQHFRFGGRGGGRRSDHTSLGNRAGKGIEREKASLRSLNTHQCHSGEEKRVIVSNQELPSKGAGGRNDFRLSIIQNSNSQLFGNLENCRGGGE